MSNPPPRCVTCKDLKSSHWVMTGPSIGHAADLGCEACKLLKSAISKFATIDAVRRVIASIDCALYLQISVEGQADRIIVEIYSEPENSTLWANIGPGHAPSSKARLHDIVARIKQWLEACQQGHAICNTEKQATSTLPTRVIDVGNSAGEVRLYQSRGETGNYVALSHCWGGSVPITTTKSSLLGHQSKIELTPSSKTFAEAAEVTRALGLRYLWIDSLCIVQDDEEDWTREAAKMNTVYRDATITLSADSALNASQGLTVKDSNRSDPHEAHTIPTKSPNGQSVMAYARRRSVIPSNPQSAPHSTSVVKPSKLSTRGWVVQERLLSTRTVHFYEEEMVWSCHGHQCCECRSMPGVPATGLLPQMLTGSPGSDIDLLLEWPKIVEEFTSKDLTFPKDRLPAISGIASIFGKVLKTRYHAGIWAADIDYSLLWMADHEVRTEPTRRMPIKPYAPTWAWASIDGPVKYIDRHMNQFNHRRSGRSEIKTCFRASRLISSPVTSNPFGPVDKAFVTARGQLLPVTYDRATKEWSPVIIHGQPVPASATTRPTVEPKFVFDVPSEAPEHMDAATLSRKRYVLLRVAVYIWGGTSSTEGTEVVALLLEFLGDMNGFMIFNRVGMVLHAFHSVRDWQGVPLQTVVIM